MARSRPQVVAVLVTCPNRRSAERIATALISRRHAACVNLLPGVTSVYEWQGRLERSAELLLIIKTTRAGFPRVQRTVLELHPYDVPEIIALPVAAGYRAYLEWVCASLSKRKQS